MKPIDFDAMCKETVAQKPNLLVRRTNSKVSKYIGHACFSLKPLECKFKAIVQELHRKKLGRRLSAGRLVVTPTLEIFNKAFKTEKYH